MVEWLGERGFVINPLFKLCSSVDRDAGDVSRHRSEARQARLRHRRRGLQAQPAGLAAAARLRVALAALGDRAQIPGREGDHDRQRHRHPGRPHRRADAGGEARAGHGRRRGGAERHAAQRGLHQGHRQRRQSDPRRRRYPHRRHRDHPARRRRDPAGAGRRARQAAEECEALQISGDLPGLRQPCGARGGRGGAPLHRRADLSGAAGRAAAPFRVARRLRHRGPWREAGAGLLRRRPGDGACRYFHARRARPPRDEEAQPIARAMARPRSATCSPRSRSAARSRSTS